MAVECRLAIQFLPGGSRGSNPALYDGGDEVAEEVVAPVQLGWAAIFASHSWMGFFSSSCVFSQSIRKLYVYAVTLLNRVLTLPHLEVISTSRAFRNSSSSALISSAFGTEEGEVFYGLTDWLGSRDPLTPYDTRVAHRFGLDD